MILPLVPAPRTRKFPKVRSYAGHWPCEGGGLHEIHLCTRERVTAYVVLIAFLIVFGVVAFLLFRHADAHGFVGREYPGRPPFAPDTLHFYRE